MWSKKKERAKGGCRALREWSAEEPSLATTRDPLSVLVVPLEMREAASANSRDCPERREPEEGVAVGSSSSALRRAARVRLWALFPPSSSSHGPGPTVEKTLPALLLRLPRVA